MLIAKFLFEGVTTERDNYDTINVFQRLKFESTPAGHCSCIRRMTLALLIFGSLTRLE